jgi:hypothetical protein
MQQLKEQMAPLLAEAAEQSTAGSCQVSSSSSTAAAASAGTGASDNPQGAAAGGCVGAVKATASQLLTNLERLDYCENQCLREEKFKQVSFGALQLYYDHDKENKKHYIKARCRLNEPVVVSWHKGWWWRMAWHIRLRHFLYSIRVSYAVHSTGPRVLLLL